MAGGSSPGNDRCTASLLLAFACVLALTPARAGDVAGRASVIDGDTLEIHGLRIRLMGIDAPESNQLCRDDGANLYRCGAKAANALHDFIASRPVDCVEVDRDRYGRGVAVCSVGGVDLSDWMVRNGLALDWQQYSKGGYAEAQKDAQRNERGMWAGSFVKPWQFRACLRNHGRAGKCADEAPCRFTRTTCADTGF